jgi:hypothetical protein
LSRPNSKSISWRLAAHKSRVQTSSFSSLVHIEVSRAGKKHAWAVTDLKAGLGVSVMRSALINMIFFSSFEQIKKRINNAGDI